MTANEEAREADFARDALKSYRLPGQYVSTREEDAFLMGHHFGFHDGVAEGIRQAREAVEAVEFWEETDSWIGWRALDAIDALGEDDRG